MLTTERISIYNYSKVSEFLSAWYAQAKAKNPRYSVRAWAKGLKLTNPTSLFRAIDDERRIPQKTVVEICNYLKLDKFEKAYFEVMSIGNGRISSESYLLLLASIKALSEKSGDEKTPG